MVITVLRAAGPKYEVQTLRAPIGWVWGRDKNSEEVRGYRTRELSFARSSFEKFSSVNTNVSNLLFCFRPPVNRHAIGHLKPKSPMSGWGSCILGEVAISIEELFISSLCQLWVTSELSPERIANDEPTATKYRRHRRFRATNNGVFCLRKWN